MSSEARRMLEEELGGRSPEGLTTLKDDELADLADRLRSAKQRQSQALEAGIGQALEIVPRLVRGSIRRILFG